jgi:hypothetical protein
MARKTQSGPRSFADIFALGKTVGFENVLLNDAEVGIVLTGGAKPLDAATIANRRYRGELNVEVIRGANREALSRLSDILTWRNRHHRGAA